MHAFLKVLEKISYKPNWEISGQQTNDQYGAGRLDMFFRQPDTYDHNHYVNVEARVNIGKWKWWRHRNDETYWERWIMQYIAAAECHEAAEWFKVNDRRLFDPHAKNRRYFKVKHIP